MTTDKMCHLSTDELKERARLHRIRAANHLGPTHSRADENDIRSQVFNYKEAQETMAEVYEELAERRENDNAKCIENKR